MVANWGPAGQELITTVFSAEPSERQSMAFPRRWPVSLGLSDLNHQGCAIQEKWKYLFSPPTSDVFAEFCV
jgi:hypothetical protein